MMSIQNLRILRNYTKVPWPSIGIWIQTGQIRLGNESYSASNQIFYRTIICKIETYLEEVSENTRKRYGGIKSKRRDQLLKMLEEVRFILNSDNES